MLSQYSAWPTRVAPLEMTIGVSSSAVGKHNARESGSCGGFDPWVHSDGPIMATLGQNLTGSGLKTQSPRHHRGARLSHGDMVARVCRGENPTQTQGGPMWNSHVLISFEWSIRTAGTRGLAEAMPPKISENHLLVYDIL